MTAPDESVSGEIGPPDVDDLHQATTGHLDAIHPIHTRRLWEALDEEDQP